MMNLTEFLLARIAEDEHDATWSPNTDWDATSVAAWAGKTPGNLAVRHAGRWSPERVLAECKAKRRVVEVWPDPFGAWNGAEADAARKTKDATLRRLALPYADHPDYREDWRRD